MKADETVRKATASTNPDVSSANHEGATYQKILDGRKCPVRGLWIRNGRYYARLSVADPNSGAKSVRRIPLTKGVTQAQAIAEMRRLQTKREDNDLPVLKQTPKFADFVDTYFQYFQTVKDAKKESTLEIERVNLRGWTKHLGHVRLHQITKPMVTGFIAKRQAEGVTGRTVNLAVTHFRNVMNKAIDDGWIQSLPTENLRPLKWTPQKRALVQRDDLLNVCRKAEEVSKNGEQFADYLKLMAFCGSRMAETLRLRWSDVDWKNRQLTIGADGQTKNRKSRVVDFNPDLQRHLKEMSRRRAPDSAWIFPSPQRGEHDRPALTFRETLLLARREAGLPRFGFHDCRHFFISMCVMSGVDFMTISRWVGHQDGGVLIGRVYGHLSNEHTQRQAKRIRFTA